MLDQLKAANIFQIQLQADHLRQQQRGNPLWQHGQAVSDLDLDGAASDVTDDRQVCFHRRADDRDALGQERRSESGCCTTGVGVDLSSFPVSHNGTNDCQLYHNHQDSFIWINIHSNILFRMWQQQRLLRLCGRLPDQFQLPAGDVLPVFVRL